MLESLLRVPDLGWDCRQLRPAASPAQRATSGAFEDLAGRFATAHRAGDRVVLIRDPLGLNKLFYAIHRDDGVIAASYLADLRDRDVPFEAIYAVPAGAMIEIAPRGQTLTCRRLHRLRRPDLPAGGDQAAALDSICTDLGRYFGHLAQQFPAAPVAVCLSGGLDSALVAALAVESFPAVTAYTYSFAGGTSPSTDLSLAQMTARHLGIPSRIVEASRSDVLAAVPDAIRFGQDWRDFNVHAAIVNVLLADAVTRDAPAAGSGSPVLVLTGDLMNELLADYAPVRYRGQEYYPLPAVGHDALRLALVRGIQAGDREVGVFQSRGLTIVQPYAAVFRKLLDLPGALGKPDVIRGLSAGRYPASFYQRAKARAQIGDAEVRHGILPVLTGSGRDSEWLEQLGCTIFGAPDQRALRNFIRAGAYRSCPDFPGRRCGQSPYLKV
jgi:hypothetical protein